MSIHKVCINGDVNELITLLEIGCDINQKNNSDESPIHLVCRHNHINLLKILLEQRNPSVNITGLTKYGWSPLYTASRYGNHGCVNLLLPYLNENDINSIANTENGLGRTSLFIACHWKAYKVVHALLQANADVNKCTINGRTPLFAVASNGKYSIVKLLLSQNNILVNKSDNFGDIPLTIACRNGKNEITKLLLNAKSDIFHKNNDGKTPLEEAMKHDNSLIVKMIHQHPWFRRRNLIMIKSKENSNDNSNYHQEKHLSDLLSATPSSSSSSNSGSSGNSSSSSSSTNDTAELMFELKKLVASYL